MSLNILHIHSGNLFGGVERLLATLSSHQNISQGMKHDIALSFEGKLSGELRDKGKEPYMLGNVRLRNPFSVLRSRRRLTQLLKEGTFDIAVCHNCWSQVIYGPLLKKQGIRSVFWSHDIPNMKNMLERIARHVKPDMVIANSEYTADKVFELYPDTPVRVYYYPVTVPSVADKEGVRKTIRDEMGVERDTTVFLHVSRMEKWKGHDLAIKALANLRSNDWRLWIAGAPQRKKEAEYCEGLKKIASGLGIENRIDFLGQIDRTDDYMKAADVFCQINRSPEPFGIVFIEAMYAGLPVISSDSGGAAEIVDEHCGILVNPKRNDMVAAAFAELMNDADKRNRMGDAGRSRAERLCSPEKQLNRLREILEDL